MARRRTTSEPIQTREEMESEEKIKEEQTAARGAVSTTPASWWKDRKTIEQPRPEDQEKCYREGQERYEQERQREGYYGPIQETLKAGQEVEEIMVMKETNEIKQVAIACQGGGSHTAFTAGALKRILKEQNGKYEIVGLSGTSGGAICALLSWYGLLTNDKDKAIKLLDSFWREISARSFDDMLLNEWVVWTSRLHGITPSLDISPYYYPPVAQELMRGILNKLVDFDKLRTLINDSSPDLLVGAADVLSGEFKVFENSDINVDAILASAAIPTLLRAIHVDGKVYWDGLFSQNPPIRSFIEDASIHEKPDEIWIIQINPQKRHYEPKSIREIEDRRNELSGNLSLYQEIDFIENVNKWIEAGYLPSDKYKHIKIRWIKRLMEDLDVASKLDRDPQFIHDMMNHGEEQAVKFLKQLT